MSAMMRTPRWIAMNWDFSCLASLIATGLYLHRHLVLDEVAPPREACRSGRRVGLRVSSSFMMRPHLLGHEADHSDWTCISRTTRNRACPAANLLFRHPRGAPDTCTDSCRAVAVTQVP